MDVQGKIKKIFAPQTLTFQDGRTYTQQLIILDCGEYSRGGDFYENDLPFYFGEKHLSKLTAVAIGAQVSVSFGIKGRAYTYTDKTDGKTQREGYSLKANAYDIKVLEQSPLVQAVQQSMPQQPQAPMQAPTAQQYAPQPQQQTPQPQPESEDALPF